MKSIVNVEPIAEGKQNDDSEKKFDTIENDSDENVVREPITDSKKDIDGKIPQPQELNGSEQQQRNSTEEHSVENNHQSNGTKRTNQPAIDQRGVFIQGYDFQVSKVQKGK